MQFAKAMSAIFFAAIMLSAYAVPARAQTVSVQNGLGEYGFGWMFMQDGACHVVMPKHVAGPFPRVTLRTSAPVESASATMITPFWPEIDLAVGVVRGGLGDRCTGTLDDLEEDRRSASAAEGDLLRLTPSGEVDRSPVTIRDRTYLTFEAEIAASEAGIAQGTSGAFVFLRGRPIGMAITSGGEESATFIRSGEIVIHLRRFLTQQGGAYAEAAPAPAESAAPDALPLVFVSATVPPVNPRFAPENMLSDGPFVFAPSRQMRFIFGFADDESHPLSRFRLTTSPGAGQTMPARVMLRRSVADTPVGFTTWTRGQVARDGLFDTGQGAARNTRWIELIVLDTWGPGDVVIDAVSAH